MPDSGPRVVIVDDEPGICRAFEELCPQSIPISHWMTDIDRVLARGEDPQEVCSE